VVLGQVNEWLRVNDALWAQGPPIYGGSDQVQRNIVGERVLGLPREPGPDRNTPFRDLLKN
jgi:alkylation response protein AidB-like acyl-CoA dehydrogenase